MAYPELLRLTVEPPLHPVEIAHRAYVALRHQPVSRELGLTCHCGARLPCPTATALLADIAADWTRIQNNTHPGPDADTTTVEKAMNCPHRPPCPAADQSDREAARLVATHPEQGWNLLCNGVVTFDDTGDLLPDGRIVAPHRALPNRPPMLAAPTSATGTPRWITAANSCAANVAQPRGLGLILDPPKPFSRDSVLVV